MASGAPPKRPQKSYFKIPQLKFENESTTQIWRATREHRPLLLTQNEIKKP